MMFAVFDIVLNILRKYFSLGWFATISCLQAARDSAMVLWVANYRDKVNPVEKLRIIGNIWTILSNVVSKSIFTGSFQSRIDQKLRSIILLHLALVTFRFTIPNTMKVIICMLFGNTSHDHAPQKPLFWCLGPPNDSKRSKKKNKFRRFCFWKYLNIGNHFFEKTEKVGIEHSWRPI